MIPILETVPNAKLECFIILQLINVTTTGHAKMDGTITKRPTSASPAPRT